MDMLMTILMGMRHLCHIMANLPTVSTSVSHLGILVNPRRKAAHVISVPVTPWLAVTLSHPPLPSLLSLESYAPGLTHIHSVIALPCGPTSMQTP